MLSVPTIDVRASVNGEPDAAVIETLRVAMTEVGFLQIVGHGVPLDLIDAAHDSIQRIDELSPPQRRALMRPRKTSRGVFEQLADDGHLLSRGYQFIPYDTLADAEEAGAVFGHPEYFEPNVWPEDDGGAFRALWKEYGSYSRPLAHVMMGLFASALGLERDHFRPAFAHDVSLFSLNWYPKQPTAALGERVLLHAHPDSGVLALLHQRGNYEGLQIVDRTGDWSTVPIEPDAYVINIGHLMSRWTNGEWPATIHRVVAGTSPDHFRSSIAMFFLPNLDEVVEPLPTMIGADGPRFAPITAYDWQQQFMEEYVLARYDWDQAPVA
jgi:isopenicillin N synthase-like dioxygenase